MVELVRYDGKLPARRMVHRPGAARSGTLGDLRDRLLATHRYAHVKNTLYAAGIRFNDLAGSQSEDYRFSDLSQSDLHKHVDRRAEYDISPVTFKSRQTSLESRLMSELARADRRRPRTDTETSDHFERTVRESEWSLVPTWHALRLSFASICASRGIEPRDSSTT